MLAQQLDMQEQLTGPSWKAAFPDGNPGPAAQAFAKKAGVAVTALEKITTAKGEYAAATVQRAGQTAAKVLTESLPQEIGALSWPKTMYWRPNKPERYVRPLRWLVCLLDETVVPLEFAGIAAGSVSYGHRVLYGDRPVPIHRPADYPAALEAAFVIADAGRAAPSHPQSSGRCDAHFTRNSLARRRGAGRAGHPSHGVAERRCSGVSSPNF